MSPSDQTRRKLATAALIITPFAAIALLGELAALASRFGAAAGVLVVLAVFGACGLIRSRRTRAVVNLPRPAEAPLPSYRDPAQLAA